jgi:hypothetical protein
VPRKYMPVRWGALLLHKYCVQFVEGFQTLNHIIVSHSFPSLNNTCHQTIKTLASYMLRLLNYLNILVLPSPNNLWNSESSVVACRHHPLKR